MQQQQPQQTGGGLFGSSTQQTTTGGGLFGSSTQQPAQQQSGGLFGAPIAKPAGGLSMFGSLGQPQQQQQQQSTGGGLFGGSILGASQQQQQQQPQNNSLFASLGPAPQSNQSSLAQSFLAGSQATPLPRLGQSQWQAPQGPSKTPLRSTNAEMETDSNAAQENDKSSNK